jgi:hypothetical protein
MVLCKNHGIFHAAHTKKDVLDPAVMLDHKGSLAFYWKAQFASQGSCPWYIDLRPDLLGPFFFDTFKDVSTTSCW